MVVETFPPSKEDLKKYKSRELIYFVCTGCQKLFGRQKNFILAKIKNNNNIYCSLECWGKIKRQLGRKEVFCGECGIKINKTLHEIMSSKSGHGFCSSSCSASYNNKHKTSGTRISKLEKFIQEQLKTTFSALEIHFNRKDAILSELDIYIPSLKLAIEINGIFHYRPIYGESKYKKIVINDKKKEEICKQKGIELFILDVSKMRDFSPKESERFLSIIIDKINQKLNAVVVPAVQIPQQYQQLSFIL